MGWALSRLAQELDPVEQRPQDQQATGHHECPVAIACRKGHGVQDLAGESDQPQDRRDDQGHLAGRLGLES